MKKYCFIVSSCIYPCEKPLDYSDVRSIYTPQERLEQTQNTIDSIHRMCPDADVFLVDNGLKDISGLLHGCTYCHYIGKNPLVRLLADCKYKTLGELTSLLFCAVALMKVTRRHRYTTFFKISGRYWLNDSFDAQRFPQAFCFYHINPPIENLFGYHKHVLGPHSTRLMAFPGNALPEFFWSLVRSIPRFLLGRSLEEAWPRHIHGQFYYMDYVGVSGHVGVNKDFHRE